MNMSKSNRIAIVLCASVAIILCALWWLVVPKLTVFGSAVQAYIYAYPLVLMDVTQKTMTHNGAYTNRFINSAEFPTDTFKNIVRPNVDTLYSFAWLDLTPGPIILSVPDTHDRYYLVEFLDAWTNVFASVGKRTTGTAAQDFIIVGPEGKGAILGGLTIIKAPTDMVLLLARTQTNGTSDYAFVHQIQAGYNLTPLDAWIDSSTHASTSLDVLQMPVDTGQAPAAIVAAMDVALFYTTFAQALTHNPPPASDVTIMARLKKFGIEPGKDFNLQLLSADVLENTKTAAFLAMAEKKDSIKRVHGWGIMFNVGTYGTDYLTRAMVAQLGIGANIPADAVYPTASVDADNNPLTGKNKYLIHFAADQLPPVNAFWSITLYNAESFLVKNSLNRYALGDRDPLYFNNDGLLDIFIQHESPGTEKESNWIPAPETEFNLSMRLYWPKQSVLDGMWQPPAIIRL